jgi:hypothetical protein
MKLRLMDGGYEIEQPEVLWTGQGFSLLVGCGDYTGYVLVRREFTDGETVDDDDLWSRAVFKLGRSEAGQLGLALITEVMRHSDGYIDYASERLERAGIY